MSNEHITDEQIAELWRTFAGTNEVLRIERRNFKHVLGAILKGIALRPAAQPAPVASAAAIADRICLDVAELPDRNSPQDWPEAMLVTADELKSIVIEAMTAQQPADPVGWQPVAEDDLTAFEKFIADRSQNAPFIPADAHTLANATMHMIREVRDTRARLSASPAAQPVGEPVVWGWAIVDNRGTTQAIRPRVQEFFGSLQEHEQFPPEAVTKMDREWAGLAPHSVVQLYTTPQPVAVPDRVPMSREDLKAFMNESGYGHVTAQEKADFINGFRSAEAHHGITTSKADK